MRCEVGNCGGYFVAEPLLFAKKTALTRAAPLLLTGGASSNHRERGKAQAQVAVYCARRQLVRLNCCRHSIIYFVFSRLVAHQISLFQAIAVQQPEPTVRLSHEIRGALSPTGDGCTSLFLHDQTILPLLAFTSVQTASDMRRLAVGYMRTNKGDFMPFLTNDQGDMMNDGERARLFIACENVAISPWRLLNFLNAFYFSLLSAEFESYLVKMETTAEWGGEHEVLLWCRNL